MDAVKAFIVGFVFVAALQWMIGRNIPAEYAPEPGKCVSAFTVGFLLFFGTRVSPHHFCK